MYIVKSTNFLSLCFKFLLLYCVCVFFFVALIDIVFVDCFSIGGRFSGLILLFFFGLLFSFSLSLCVQQICEELIPILPGQFVYTINEIE